MNRNFSNAIENWYKEYKRELPWRDSADPYVIWISEIILQQTRVVQGYDYFVRFMKRFPDVATLAEADEDEVMKYWQGLGYYSRARNLHAAAKSMNGVFPKTYPEVRALKGVGEYTAAAICSFAYNMPYAVVDGNVYRVLSRYLGIDTPIDSTEGKKLFAAVADELLDRKNPALYNQAIMDFGAIQCSPQTPNCMFCPLADSCAALAKGTVAELPVKQHKIKTTNRYFNYIYVRMGVHTFINKRTGNDIWRNLFELPLIETPVAIQILSAQQRLSILFRVIGNSGLADHVDFDLSRIFQAFFDLLGYVSCEKNHIVIADLLRHYHNAHFASRLDRKGLINSLEGVCNILKLL